MRSRSRVSVGLALAGVCLLGVWGASAAGLPREPEGFGRAKFLMTIDRVKELYPDLQPLGTPTDASAGFPVVDYVLHNQSLGDLKCTTVQFRFFKKQLTHLQFYCGDKEKAGQ